MEHINLLVWSGVGAVIFFGFTYILARSKPQKTQAVVTPPIPVGKYSWDEFMRDVESDVSLDTILEKARNRGGIPKRPKKEEVAIAVTAPTVVPVIYPPYIGTPVYPYGGSTALPTVYPVIGIGDVGGVGGCGGSIGTAGGAGVSGETMWFSSASHVNCQLDMSNNRPIKYGSFPGSSGGFDFRTDTTTFA